MDECISVIMSTYNEQEVWLRKSIESILGQTYANLEFIIVIDNPQNEDLIRVVEEYAHKDSRVRIIKNSRNLGLVQSLNLALQQVSGSIVARMDADDISYPDRLEQEYRFMQEYHADFVMGTVDYIDEFENVDTNTFEKQYIGEEFNRILKVGNISAHPTWLLKKDVYQELKGYRDIDGCEDFDFLLRAVQKGYRCARMSRHILCYRMRRSGISRSKAMEQFVKMNYWRKLYRKNIVLENHKAEESNILVERIPVVKRNAFQKSMIGLWKGKELIGQKKYIKGMGCVMAGVFRSRL